MAKAMSLPTVNLKNLLNLMERYYNNDVPIYLWGRPSTGKTSIVRVFAKQKCEEINRSRAAKKLPLLTYSEDKFGPEFFTLKVITLSQYDSPDLRGMPEISGEVGTTRVTNFVPTAELPRDGQGILFFDEMNMADDSTRAACYQMILEGRYGALPPVIKENGNPAYWRLAASNSEDDFCNVNILQLALLRRFAHLQVVPDSEEILDYMFKAQLDPRVIAYLKVNSTDLFPIEWKENLIERKANPFPSMWEAAAKLIEGENDYAVISALISSCVGADLATKMVAFCKLVATVDLDAILKNPKAEIAKINKLDGKASLMYSITISLSNMWREEKKGVTPTVLMDVAKELDPDFQVIFVKFLYNAGGKRISEFLKPATRDSFSKILSKCMGLIDELENQK